MIYDFNKEIERRGTNCVKWDEAEEGVLPLWVADMDFETAPCVQEAILQRAQHGVYGYNLVPESFYDAIIWWNSHRHGWTPRREWMLYTSGVVPAISAIIKGLCRPGDGVLFFTPAYNCFFSSVRNNGCRLVGFPLTWASTDEYYTIDFESLEQTIIREKPRLLLLCNPHNPTGRVWTFEELETLAQLCCRHDVIVLSDEIHCEFVDPELGRRYQPFAPIAEKSGCSWVIANAPNKAFNIAGLQTAYIVASDDGFRTRIDRAINDNEVCDINCFSFVALQAAYTPEGEEWLDQLVAYIYANYRFFRETMKAARPELPIARLEGTYLAWVDVSSWACQPPYDGSSERLAAELRQQRKVWINGGEMYGQGGFLRVNLATQRSRLAEALRRILSA
ncbi:MAG: pyridoxal phosphate-dependent aminotransferase [Prevotella sp.]|nr:pyridoxal phosphate-dependent aminotransferase [Prevotella sp.]